MQGVLYVSHGSRVAEAVEEATSLIARVQTKLIFLYKKHVFRTCRPGYI